MDNETFPVLYLLMRDDLTSLNCGKLAAQASHASNAFVKRELEFICSTHDFGRSWDFAHWENSTDQGFGTVLVLAVNEIQMRTAVDVASKLGFPSEVIHDPTYPLRDGDTCHFLPLDTGSYIFGDKNDPMLGAVVGNFPLYP